MSDRMTQRALAHRIVGRTRTGETPGPGQRTEAEADAYVLAQLVARQPMSDRATLNIIVACLGLAVGFMVGYLL